MRNKRQGYDLVVTQSQSSLTQRRVHGCLRQFRHRAPISRQRVFEFIVAMQTCDLFDHIDFAFHVQAPARDMHLKLLVSLSSRNYPEPQLFQDAKHLSRLQIPAQNALYLGKPQHYRCLVHCSRHYIDSVAHQFSAT